MQPPWQCNINYLNFVPCRLARAKFIISSTDRHCTAPQDCRNLATGRPTSYWHYTALQVRRGLAMATRGHGGYSDPAVTSARS